MSEAAAWQTKICYKVSVPMKVAELSIAFYGFLDFLWAINQAK